MFQGKFRGRELLVAVGGGILLGCILATPFLPLPPLWQQAMVGLVLTGYLFFVLWGSSLFARRRFPVPNGKAKPFRFKRFPQNTSREGTPCQTLSESRRLDETVGSERR